MKQPFIMYTKQGLLRYNAFEIDPKDYKNTT